MSDREQINGDTAVPGVEPAYRGKVRDIYDLGDMLLIVATDRISAYDSVLPTPIPGKGIMLNMLSAQWFEFFDTVPNHMISVDVDDYPAPFSDHPRLLSGRSMLVKKARRIDLECIVRGYISGSGWREYREHGSVCGISLPRGLKPIPSRILSRAKSGVAIRVNPSA